MRALLSYPMAGRTWVRFMVDSYLCHRTGLAVDNVFEVELDPQQPARIVWTHLTAAMLLQRHWWEMGPIQLGEETKVPWVLLQRNFYATLASAYFQARDRIHVFNGTPALFLHSSRHGILKLISFYNLREQLPPQLTAASAISYEAVLADTPGTLGRILEALEIPVEEGAGRARGGRGDLRQHETAVHDTRVRGQRPGAHGCVEPRHVQGQTRRFGRRTFRPRRSGPRRSPCRRGAGEPRGHDVLSRRAAAAAQGRVTVGRTPRSRTQGHCSFVEPALDRHHHLLDCRRAFVRPARRGRPAGPQPVLHRGLPEIGHDLGAASARRPPADPLPRRGLFRPVPAAHPPTGSGHLQPEAEGGRPDALHAAGTYPPVPSGGADRGRQMGRRPADRLHRRKTPEHAMCLEKLEQAFPAMRVIHVVRDGRDGRDVAVSGWFHNLHKAGEKFRAQFPDFPSYIQYLAESHWIPYIRAARRFEQKHRDRHLEVRYEQLHADTATQTARMLAFLGREDSGDSVRLCTKVGAFETLAAGRKQGAEDRASFYRKGAVGDWREHFDDQCIETFERCGGSMLRELGYAENKE